jgi:hypothetical protein
VSVARCLTTSWPPRACSCVCSQVRGGPTSRRALQREVCATAPWTRLCRLQSCSGTMDSTRTRLPLCLLWPTRGSWRAASIPFSPNVAVRATFQSSARCVCFALEAPPRLLRWVVTLHCVQVHNSSLLPCNTEHVPSHTLTHPPHHPTRSPIHPTRSVPTHSLTHPRT